MDSDRDQVQDQTPPTAPAPDRLDTLGMTEAELFAYLEEILREEATEAAEAGDTTPAEELASPGFMAARAASTYAISLILANNAYLARHLLDLGVLPGAGTGNGERGTGAP